jgi:hypothetical protein
MNINDLNDDCLKQVFSRLSLKEKVNCERVCKLWKQLMDQVFLEQLYLQIKFINEFKVAKLDCAVSKILEKCTNLRSIDLTDVQIDDKIIELVLKKCKKLKNLICSKSTTLNDSLISVFITGNYANQLTNINISNQCITDLALKCLLKSCTNLIVMDISKNDKITGELSFQYFGPHIKSLNLENCRYIREEGILLLVSGSGKNLNELKIGSYISEDIIKQITANMKNLLSFSISAYFYPQTFRAQDLESIAKLVKLEHLALKNLPLLQNCFDQTLITILKMIPKLKSLKLIVAQISDQSFEALPKYCPLLQSLEYQYSVYPNVINNNLTNKGAFHLIHLNRLQKLSIKGTKIGDTMADVIQSNRKIKYLNLFYCENISQITLNACIDLVKSNLKTRITVKLKGCKKLDSRTDLPKNISIDL